jgi:multidrug efflux pump subunit AcrA (membrane-fusion protein)
VEIKVQNIDGSALKPSMRCSAEIFVEEVKEVLFVPIHSIHRTGGVVWVWVQRGGGFAQQPITIGKFSESYVSVLEGLRVGDVVLLREPAVGQIVSRLAIEGRE